MNKTNEGLYEFISTFEVVLDACSTNRNFFLELARFMKTISKHDGFKHIIATFNEDRNELESVLDNAEKVLDETVESHFEKLINHKDFPNKNPQIEMLLNELANRKKYMYLTSEPMAEMKYQFLLKCMEALDNGEYAHIIDDFKNSKESSVKYNIFYDYRKYDAVKRDFKVQSEASVWSSYDRLMLLPLCLYDYSRLYDSRQQQNDMEEDPNKFFWYLNLQGIYLEFWNLINGREQNPVEFKRAVYEFHYEKLVQYLGSYLKGLYIKSEKYEHASTNISVEGLFEISTRNRQILYIGKNNRKGVTYTPTQRNQIYTLIVELAKANGHKLTFDRIKKYLNDPKRCDRPWKERYISDDAQMMKSLVARSVNSIGMSPEELKVNEYQKSIYLQPFLPE